MTLVRAYCCTCVLSMAVLVALATGATYVVHPDGTGEFPTIQAAIDAAEDGDIIELADGTFTGDGNRDLTYLGKAITVRSQSGDPDLCIIDCGGSLKDPHRGFVFDSGEGPASVLDGVTITGGNARTGAGIYCDVASPTILHCTLLMNRADDGRGGGTGGGMYCGAGSPALHHCTFAYNGARGGGGLACGAGSPTLTDCAFTGNEVSGVNGTGLGGGMYCGIGSGPVLTGCRFSDNRATGGAAMFCYGSSLALTNCMLAGNTVYTPPEPGDGGDGGAMHCGSSTVTLTHCTLSGNTADRSGGGMYCHSSSSITLTSCMLLGNRATEGGGIYCASALATLTRCTLSGNSAVSGSGLRAYSDTRITNTIIAFGEFGAAISCDGATLDCCDVYGNAGGDWVGCIAGQYGLNGNISEDPLFCDPGNEDFTLDASSLCAPEHSGGCGLIGALPVGCEGTAVAPTTWGAVKASFR